MCEIKFREKARSPVGFTDVDRVIMFCYFVDSSLDRLDFGFPKRKEN